MFKCQWDTTYKFMFEGTFNERIVGFDALDWFRKKDKTEYSL